jgi:hypothetical protein
MKQIQKKLMIIFWAMVLIPLAFAALMDADLIETGLLAGNTDGQTEFVCQMAVVLISLAMIPIALKFFRFKAVALKVREQYLRLSVCRMLMLEVPLLLNLAGYYLFVNSSFFYLGVIMLVAFVFVYPSMDRCLYETEQKEESQS